ncbi:hypothetical protein [Mesorhizobium sp. 113-3-3]|uniref:hypothetical protein n=1 Tax=Mesorhizobium sp. 113-3-3 TaxID=2744516 RepID=UPI0018ECC4B0|nr:hypothetical protein [Mesorhizobium sp. 113-3-3]
MDDDLPRDAARLLQKIEIELLLTDWPWSVPVALAKKIVRTAWKRMVTGEAY